MENIVRIAGPILLALLFMAPMIGLHVFARYFMEPSVAPIDDACKDPKSKPGSRAQVTWTMLADNGSRAYEYPLSRLNAPATHTQVW